MSQIRAQMGDKWSEKGLAEHDAYDGTKKLLSYLRDEAAEQCFRDDEAARREFIQRWPFDA